MSPEHSSPRVFDFKDLIQEYSGFANALDTAKHNASHPRVVARAATVQSQLDDLEPALASARAARNATEAAWNAAKQAKLLAANQLSALRAQLIGLKADRIALEARLGEARRLFEDGKHQALALLLAGETDSPAAQASSEASAARRAFESAEVTVRACARAAFLRLPAV